MKGLKQRKKEWLCGVIILAILFPSIWRIYQVNAAFPPAEKIYVEFGEEYQMEEDFMVQVHSMELLDQQQLEERYGEYISWTEGHDYKGILVKIGIRNLSKETKKFEMYKFYIETDTYYNNGIDRDMYLLENPDGFLINLKEGEEKEVYLAYSMWDNHFYHKNWENLDSVEFYLVNERYPKKVYWKTK